MPPRNRSRGAGLSSHQFVLFSEYRKDGARADVISTRFAAPQTLMIFFFFVDFAFFFSMHFFVSVFVFHLARCGCRSMIRVIPSPPLSRIGQTFLSTHQMYDNETLANSSPLRLRTSAG